MKVLIPWVGESFWRFVYTYRLRNNQGIYWKDKKLCLKKSVEETRLIFADHHSLSHNEHL